MAALILGLCLLAPACTPGRVTAVLERLSPAAVTPTPAAIGPPPECAPIPVLFRFRFAPETTQADRTLLRTTMRLARDYFPLRHPRTARYSYVEESYRCYPERYVESVTTTADQPPDERVAEYGRGEGPLFFISAPTWLVIPAEHRAVIMFHEAYHWFQWLGQSRAPSGQRWDTDLPHWLQEGSAEWAGFEAAVHFGLYPSMESARSHHARFQGRALKELRKHARYIGKSFDAYSLFFFAADELADEHGGRLAMRRYWQDQRDDEWEVRFRRTFGLTPRAFYAAFEEAA
ncbi:MAG: hypothetical protein WD770_09400 [Actinomycetota bacterium]